MAASRTSRRDPRLLALAEDSGYEIQGRIGAGGMGIVYRALDADGNDVAIKLLRHEISDDPAARARLAREVSAQRLVRNDNIVRILDAELDSNDAFVVTEFIPGPTLEEAVRTYGALHPEAVREIGLVLGETLRDIHRAGVIHRDLKPSNIMLRGATEADLTGFDPEGDRLDPVIIDFGIAIAAEESRLTSTGLVMGTAAYLDPEVIRTDHTGEAGDWWALAALLSFAATGREPYGTGRADLVFLRAERGEIDVEGAPTELADWLRSALRADPGARPAPEQLLQELADLDLTRYDDPGPTEALEVGERTAALPVVDDDEQEPPAGAGDEPATEVLPVLGDPQEPAAEPRSLQELPEEPATEALPVTGPPTKALPVIPATPVPPPPGAGPASPGSYGPAPHPMPHPSASAPGSHPVQPIASPQPAPGPMPQAMQRPQPMPMQQPGAMQQHQPAPMQQPMPMHSPWPQMPPPPPRRPLLVWLGHLLLIAFGGIAPYVSLTFLLLLGALARTWERSHLAVAGQRLRGAAGSGPLVRAGLAAPFRLLAGIVETALQAVLPLVLGLLVGLATDAAWTLLMAGVLPDAVVFIIAMTVTLAITWVGLGSRTTRNGAHRLLDAAAPDLLWSAVVVVLLVLLLGAVGFTLAARGGTVDYFPFLSWPRLADIAVWRP